MSKLVEERLKELAGLAIDALARKIAEGDVQAVRTVLERTHPAPRHPGSLISVPELADDSLTLEEKARSLNGALGNGDVTVEQYLMLTRALESQSRMVDLEQIVKIVRLVDSGKTVEDAIRKVKGALAREEDFVAVVTPHGSRRD